MRRLLWVPAMWLFTVAYIRLRLCDVRGIVINDDDWLYQSIRCQLQHAYDLGARAKGTPPFKTQFTIEEMMF